MSDTLLEEAVRAGLPLMTMEEANERIVELVCQTIRLQTELDTMSLDDTCEDWQQSLRAEPVNAPPMRADDGEEE
jgi:hypothetical protein